MLLVVSLILNFVFLNCDKEKKESFNESILIAQHHQHLKQIKTFLKTVHQNIHEERTVQDMEHETTGHDKEHYTITELLKTTQDSSIFVSTLRQSKDIVFARAYEPTFPWKSSTNGGLEQSSKFSYPVETTVNWYKYFSLPSPTVKTRHPLGYYSKHRRRRTTKNLHEKFVFLSSSTTKQTRKPDTKKSQEHIDISSPSSVVAKTARIHKSPMNYDKSVPNRHKAIIIFQKQSGVPNPSSFLSNTQRVFKPSILSQEPALTITDESTLNVNKQFGLPTPNSNNPFHRSSKVDTSESTSIKPVSTKAVATMNSHKNTGLPSFIPPNTTDYKKPSKSQKSGEVISHDSPFTNKSTTVNLYELFGLPSPSPTSRTICPGTRHIRRYSSKYPKKKKPDFPEPTGYELSSEDLVPRKKVNVFPPILFSSEVIPQNYFPPYKQIELSSPRTVNSYSEESLRNFPTFQNILTPQEPKKSPSTYSIDRTLSSGTRKTATSKRKLPTSTYRPIFLSAVDKTTSSGTKKTATSKRKSSTSTYRPIFLRGVDRTVSPDVRETPTSKWKSLASTKNINEKKIRVHRVRDRWWHSLTVKDRTPRHDIDRRRQIIHKPRTRKIRTRLLNRKLRTSSSSPRVTLQGISSSSEPKSRRLEDHDSMVSEGGPVVKAYEKKIADTGVLHKAASPYLHFEDLMAELHEGYLPVFLMELARLIAAKQPKVVYNVVGHTNSVLTELFKRSNLRWFGQPLRDVTISIGRYLAQTDIAAVRNYARTLHNLLHSRRSSLPAHVNSIIDAASLLYEPLEGYAFFDSLMEFEKYPYIARTGRQVCSGLIKNFLRPFRRLHHSKRCQELLVTINDVLATSFSSYRLRILGSSEDSDEENQSRSMKYVFKRTRKNKRRQRRRYKPKMNRNERPNRRHYTQVETFKLRRMKPSTEQQKQLSIILPKHRRANTHTNAHFKDKKTRKTTDYSHTQAKQFFHDDILGADDGKLLDRREFTRHRSDLKADAKGKISAYLQKNRSEESRSVKVGLKTGMLRIPDSSSYSDEEEALKSNLVQALMQGNGSAVDSSVRKNSAMIGDDAVESVKEDTENKLIIQSSEESHFLLKDKK